MRLALTFDDGPSEWTAAILDLLETHDAKATFFVCEAHLHGNELLALRARQEGHQLGNHTSTHPSLDRLDARDTFQEIADCSLAIHDLTGQPPTVFRPPYLRMTDAAQIVADQLGMATVGCDTWGLDWEEADPDAVARKVLHDADDGHVVLLHDGRPPNQPPRAEGGSLDSRQHVVGATSRILAALRGACEFVTVDELYRVAV